MTDDTNTTYNGWKNYPTWAVNLWLSNDEGLYHATLELVADTAEGVEATPYSTVEEYTRYLVADSLKCWVCDDLAPDLGATFSADLLGYALDCVDWNEIATHWLAEVHASVPYDD